MIDIEESKRKHLMSQLSKNSESLGRLSNLKYFFYRDIAVLGKLRIPQEKRHLIKTGQAGRAFQKR